MNWLNVLRFRLNLIEIVSWLKVGCLHLEWKHFRFLKYLVRCITNETSAVIQ
jgi:hypothetical protein